MNNDGFNPGQEVSWADMMRANKARTAQTTTGSAPPTREDIAGMKKADVAALLEAHGAPVDGNLPELRARLIDVMFVGL